MPWARIDDAFDDHPKVLAVLEHDQGGAAIGLWTLCLTWAHRKRRRGVPRGTIPREVGERFAGRNDAAISLLVQTGLWRIHDDGWAICDDAEIFRWGAPGYQMPWISRQTRRRIYVRDGHACVECGATDDLTLDHTHPRSRGGGHGDENLRTLCRSCNSRKGARV